ncbi:unnamed protein product [Pieris macdunnoughi]|uniref:Reverse transcriptase/retrotransposon-derived protein RNase H-like domain-containing protein n=1 Tax=Pieris macdunnoughi TaxID=345717 RepID=A0A821XQH9_9NEOP|nr:unnamed protein product [Pieris macdunnoughi]
MEELALHHFQLGVSPRISNIVRCKSPKSLNEAINIAISEEKIQQFLFKTNPHKEKFTKVSTHKSDPPTSSNTKSSLFCRYCKNSGHTLENCRKREYNNKLKSQNSRTPQRVHHLIQQDNSNSDTNEGYDTVDYDSDSKNETKEVLNQLRLSHLNSEEKEALLQLCSNYSDIFHLPNENLTYTNAIRHEIRTTTDVPIHTKTYRFPEIHKVEVRNQIDKMLKFPIPKNPKDIKSFLGLVSYYRRFMPDFSNIAKPLTSFLKKDQIFSWENQQQLAFELLKEKLTSAPVLSYPDFTKPFILTTDASNHALGVVLSQGPTGQERPIAFASRTLNKSESNYSTTEKELAIIFGCKTFRPYLYGQRFQIVTDHRPLKWLFNHC